MAYQFPDEPTVVSAAVEFRMPSGATSFNGARLPVIAFRPSDGVLIPPDRLSEFFPESFVSEFADVDLDLSTSPATFRFRTDLVTGGGTLHRGHATPMSVRPALEMSWAQFRSWAFEQAPRDLLYRGQQDRWRLRTSFHRTCAKVIPYYQRDSIPEIHRLITGPHGLDYNLSDADDMGAFYNLLRHHGYPTPLLDWSESPFVAAFFAFDGLRPDQRAGVVRIYALHAKAWCGDLLQMPTLGFASPHFSVLALGTRGNPRAVPQQAVATLCNVDDIEMYIGMIEAAREQHYLTAVDIPAEDRQTAMNDLLLMGIHSGSMMPGIDGTCRSMAYRHFEYLGS